MNKKPKVLLVEDEQSLRDALKLNLELENYEVQTAETGTKAVNTFNSQHFDIAILDIMLPEMDGVSVCEAIRLKNEEIPIMFLSAKNAPADKVNALKKGGDDYMTKPFNLEELLVRVNKMLTKVAKSHKPSTEMEVYSFSNNHITFSAYIAVNYKGEEIKLTKKEALLLKLLIENKGNVVSREHILQVVWGYDVFPNTRTIDNFILNFRKYFESDTRAPQHFFSIRGVGYKFEG